MKVEVLASVMNASLPETVQHMNLQSDAVIINQCDRLGQEEMQISPGNGRIRFCSFPDRGIGRSRNEAILRAEGDICLFSDADIVYEDGYEAAVLAEFERNPRADMIIFNIEVEEERNGNRWVGISPGGMAQSVLLYAEKACCNLVLRSPCCLAAVQNTAMEKTACF